MPVLLQTLGGAGDFYSSGRHEADLEDLWLLFDDLSSGSLLMTLVRSSEIKKKEASFHRI